MTEDRENNAFVIQIAYFLEDTGDYVAVGYADGGRTAWLPEAIIPILVTERQEWVPGGTSTGGTGGTPGNSDTNVGNSGGGAAGGNSGGNDVTYSSNKETGTTHSEEKNVQEEEEQEAGKKASLPKVAKVKKCKVKAKRKGVVLTWKKSPGVSGYQVQISTKKNFKGAKKTFIKKSKNSYTVSNLKPGKKYYIRIRAYQIYQTQTGSKKTSYGKWVVKSSRTKR